MKRNNNDSFWPSYVDIMTTLFAITLVLFAVSYSKFKTKQEQLELLVAEYENIVNVYTTVNEIDESEMFDYDSTYLKHLMTIDIQYQEKEYDIQHHLLQDKTNPSKAEAIREDILSAGRTIQEKIMSLEDTLSDSSKKNIKFLIVIEGQSSKLKFNDDSWHNNYTLSYLRAQHLNIFWKEHGIDLGAMNHCELLISGSGEGGVPRIKPRYPRHDTKEEWNIWRKEESRNQRFLVNIVPVIGNIDVTRQNMQKLTGTQQDTDQ